jgi:hypothetical protein
MEEARLIHNIRIITGRSQREIIDKSGAIAVASPFSYRDALVFVHDAVSRGRSWDQIGDPEHDRRAALKRLAETLL